MSKHFAFTLDLEADYAGPVHRYGIFEEPEKIKDVLAQLSSMGVKITVFAMGEIFEHHADIIKIFESYNCEFEVHSYSHNVSDRCFDHEIKKARSAYFNYFGRYPTGYRAPQGRISAGIITALERNGFLYDSSIFPSYYPNPLRYLFCNRDIHYFGASDIMEMPLTSITPFRLTLSLSYIKLLGIGLYLKLFQVFGLPDVICFSSHLHDFIVNENSYSKLPCFWKFIYGRNKFSGIDFCGEFLKYIKRERYQFCFLSEVYKNYRRDKIG